MSMVNISVPPKFRPMMEDARPAPLLSDGSYRMMTFSQSTCDAIDEHGAIIPLDQYHLYGHKRKKFYIYYGGRGGGKSEQLAMISIIKKALIHNYVILCCRQTFTSIKDSLFATIVKWIKILKVEHLFTVIENEIRCKSTGSKFLFRGLKVNAQEIKSMNNVGLVVVDEAVDVDDETWEWLIPTPRVDGAEFFVSFNTGTTEDATYVRFVTQADNRCFTCLVNISDNPLAPQILLDERDASLALAKVTKNYDKYNNTWLGIPKIAKSGNVFFPSQMRIVPVAPICVRWVRGWDFASSAVSEKNPSPDYTVGALMGVTAEGLYVISDIVRLQGTADEVETALKNTCARDGLTVLQSIPVDPGGAGKAMAFYQTRMLAGYRIHSSPESGSKIVRAEPFAAQVNIGNVVMVRDSTNDAVIKEMTAFGSELGHDDIIDSLSRAFSQLQINHRLQLVDVLGL